MTKQVSPRDALLSTAHLFRSQAAYNNNRDQIQPNELYFMPVNPFPTGAIYMSLNPQQPAELFGGEWGALDEGRVLLGAGGGYSAGSKGGEERHTLSYSEMPSHTHSGSSRTEGSHYHFNRWGDWGANRWGQGGNNTSSSWGWNGEYNELASRTEGSHSHSISMNSNGSGYSHNNMQPYLSVYMWHCIKQQSTARQASIKSMQTTVLDTMHLFKSLGDIEAHKTAIKPTDLVLCPYSPFPVGAFYFSMDNQNPSKHFGGVWEAVEEGRVLIGANSSHPAGQKGGSATHTLSTSEIPSHSHSISLYSTGDHNHGTGIGCWANLYGFYQNSKAYGSTTNVDRNNSSLWLFDNGAHSHGNGWTSYTGSGQAHENMQPYIAVHIWNRIAQGPQ